MIPFQQVKQDNTEGARQRVAFAAAHVSNLVRNMLDVEARPRARLKEMHLLLSPSMDIVLVPRRLQLLRRGHVRG